MMIDKATLLVDIRASPMLIADSWPSISTGNPCRRYQCSPYSLSPLNKRLFIPTRNERASRLVKQVIEEKKRKSGIVFSPTIIHAQSFASMLRLYGFMAEAISSETDARERDVLMPRFRAGQFDLVASD